MKRAQLRQMRELLIQLAALKEDLDKLHWEIGEETPVEKSIKITKASASLKNAIVHLTEVI